MLLCRVLSITLPRIASLVLAERYMAIIDSEMTAISLGTPLLRAWKTTS